MDYPYIRAWGNWMGSTRHYIEHEVALAQKGGAPDNAIYREVDGTWVTADQIVYSETRQGIERLVEGMKEESQ